MGVDRLDFTALFSASRYVGTDAVADGYVSFASDGQGGTKVFYDTDGRGAGNPWSFLITTLDHVAPGDVSAATLFGGAAPVPVSSAPAPIAPSAGPAASTTPSTGGLTLAGTDAHASALTGGSGADTLISQHQADTLIGGGGADTFAFTVLPWNAGHITDFQVGVDKLDFSALFAAAGYQGSDPVGDGHVILGSDELGGTRVSFDPDGAAPGTPWPFTITTLDHVSPTGLTTARLFAGASNGASASTAATPASGPVTEAAGSVALSGHDAGVSQLGGGAGADTLSAAHQADILTGGAGHDVFKFGVLPWNAGHVTDFTPGDDLLDLRAIFQAAGYHGVDPVADGYLILQDDGHGGTTVLVDVDGRGTGNPWPTTITTLDHVAPSSLHASDWLI